ncbi:hypothetical protein VOLCADRAFT_115811 [Volvox carteri f. nagariensis]|uniref:Uncharacterized protein n=1 Tax=Volvox carteri f. nagariensis TaxID=3068 RepID=D8TIF6_VOLCA|nr:uncharacterized protein VOLCADRAFT_115811 [Volvox carteri f. nagariensis]EFJ53232.1 hypothetical protein VOLCADRAFT_115811 [Volvox carteri f. nagariensis]|eukprot:XP_002946237.1 hypothetical protein VOLCADRAFT_115811 [Volvox carteri f. nagariensis]
MRPHPLRHSSPSQPQRGFRAIRSWSQHSDWVLYWNRALTAPAATVPPIPKSVQQKLTSARCSWLDRCLDSPLVDPATNSRVHVYGNVHFAPFGGPVGLADLYHLLDRVQPTVLAIEQPYDLALCPGEAPQPDDSTPGIDDLRLGTQHPPFEMGASPRDAKGAPAATIRPEQVERLRTLLPGLAQQARIGRDLLDPFEVLGLYGGCDYVTRPSQLVEALALFGYLPGLEYAALVSAAQQRGVQVYSVDAPLRLQEKWVSQLVSDFTLQETDLMRRLQHDLARAQALLPAEYLAWDVALAEALQRIDSRSQRVEAGEGGGADSREPSLGILTGFKVSRAVAAATVPYEASREAFGLQAALQPLKFALFARRAKHLVLQIRDLCQRMSVRQVRVDADKFKGIAAAAAAAAGQAGGRKGASLSSSSSSSPMEEDVALVDASEQPEKVVLAVVGRQYVPYIEELWANERSALWHGDVRRTFARSMLDQRGSSS